VKGRGPLAEGRRRGGRRGWAIVYRCVGEGEGRRRRLVSHSQVALGTVVRPGCVLLGGKAPNVVPALGLWVRHLHVPSRADWALFQQTPT
jgi:hypothetical protein